MNYDIIHFYHDIIVHIIAVISDRQTTSFIDNSIEAGILLGGNGAFTPWGSLSLSRARSLYDLV